MNIRDLYIVTLKRPRLFFSPKKKERKKNEKEIGTPKWQKTTSSRETFLPRVPAETRSISLRRWRHEKFSKSSLINLTALATISREIQFLKLDSNVRLPRSRSCIPFVCVCSRMRETAKGIIVNMYY